MIGGREVRALHAIPETHTLIDSPFRLKIPKNFFVLGRELRKLGGIAVRGPIFLPYVGASRIFQAIAEQGAFSLEGWERCFLRGS